MIPNNSLIQPPQQKEFIYPDNLDITDLLDYELGGIGLSDPSEGLQYQVWTARVRGVAASTYVTLEAPNYPETTYLTLPNITWVRLAFDQNMHPVICVVYQSGPAFYWYDPTIPGNTLTALPNTAITPCCTMDDKRPLETRLGTNDVIIGYLKSNNLYYVQQRDRYGTEYLLLASVQLLIANPLLVRIGMDVDYRLQFQITGQLYQ